jgi:hypothetical protein
MARTPATIPVRPGRFELPTSGFVGQRSIQLSYGRALQQGLLGVRGPRVKGTVARLGVLHRTSSQRERTIREPPPDAPAPKAPITRVGVGAPRRRNPTGQKETRGYRPPVPRVWGNEDPPHANRRTAAGQAPRPSAVTSEAAQRKRRRKVEAKRKEDQRKETAHGTSPAGCSPQPTRPALWPSTRCAIREGLTLSVRIPTRSPWRWAAAGVVGRPRQDVRVAVGPEL